MKTDTNISIEEIYFCMIMAKSPEQRFKMGCSMFDSAKKIVISSIKDKSNMKEELFLRFYGDDFEDERKKDILKRISNFNYTSEEGTPGTVEV